MEVGKRGSIAEVDDAYLPTKVSNLLSFLARYYAHIAAKMVCGSLVVIQWDGSSPKMGRRKLQQQRTFPFGPVSDVPCGSHISPVSHLVLRLRWTGLETPLSVAPCAACSDPPGDARPPARTGQI